MSESPNIVVVGSGAMADAVAAAVSHSRSCSFAGVIRTGESVPEGSNLVLNLTSGSDQIATLRSLSSANVPVATLPVVTSDSTARAVLTGGHVVQVNPLRGFESLEAFRNDVRASRAGKPYGIFGAYRVRQGRSDLFASVGVPLLHFAFELFDEPLTRVQATAANLFGAERDAWFVIARGKQDLIVTLEFAASLASSAPAPEQILFEATGSEGVLRAEPSRQVVQISGSDGGTRDIGWWPDEAAGFVDAAIQASDVHEPGRELAFLDFVAAVRQSAETGQTVELS